MKRPMTIFLRDEEGQDLIEYTLLLGFIVMASAALAISSGGGIQGIMGVTTSNLNAANAAAS